MAAEPAIAGGNRHSILDLAPLELDCMNALWPAGEATVRQIQEALRPTRPRAYTTIMTILDRLAHKGIVARRKSGRAWVYRASVSADQARAQAVSQVVEGFFGGSAGALASHLGGHSAASSGSRPVHTTRTVLQMPSAAKGIERGGEAPAISVPAANSPEAAAPENLDPALL